MSLAENKRVLFVVRMEQELDYEYILQKYHIRSEEVSVIESHEINRIHPFGDLMRDILKQVYVKNIEEVFIVNNEGERKNDLDLLRKMEKNLELGKDISTLNYLFDHCMAEFSDRTVKEWLVGNEEILEAEQSVVEIICSHPLMPDSIKVKQVDGSCSLLCNRGMVRDH